MRALSIYPSRILSQKVLKNMRKVKDAWIKSQESNTIERQRVLEVRDTEGDHSQVQHTSNAH